MRTTRSGSSRSVWRAVLIGALIVVLMRVCGSSAEPARSNTAAADDTRTVAPRAHAPALALDVASATPAKPHARTRWWKPGMPHDYGSDVDPFIVQPQDYGSDTPAILGNRISYHVFDLELVQDMVRRGDEPSSEIAQVRGAPLTASERAAARRVLQRFFDDTVPDVDAVIGGTLTRDDAYARIGPRRLVLDRELRAALGLSPRQVGELWPHIAARDQMRARMAD